MPGDLRTIVGNVRFQVDEFEFPIIANSFAYDEGLPERNVVGLDNGDVSRSENRETAVGIMKCEIPSTTELIDNAKTVGNRESVTVRAFNDDGFERVMKTGVCKNRNEITTGTDGKFPFEFHGTQLD